MIETIHPATEEEWLNLRTKDITSSECAALFGCSPYLTAFELWHRKKEGKVVSAEWNQPMIWGTRLQDAIAEGVAKDNGWTVRKMTEYMRDPALRMGSSFDFEINGNIVEERIIGGSWGTNGILEIKNVYGMIFKDQWLENDDGSLEAPPHIEIQVQHQLAVSGRAFAIIAALVDGNKVVLIKRTPDQEIINAIKFKVLEFWDSIDKNTPPPPNFQEDSGFISKLYGFAEPGKVLSAHGDAEIESLAAEHKKFLEMENVAKAGKEAMKAKLLMKIGDAEKVVANGFSITAGMVGPTLIEAYERSGFRAFRINWPRGKKK